VSDLDYARRRMLAVARAVAGGHSVLLLDEPASGLGEPQTRHLGEVLRRLATERGIAIFLIEHNIDMVLRTCDRVYALDFGVLIGQGTPSEIRSNPAVVEAYLGTTRFTAENAQQQLDDQSGPDTEGDSVISQSQATSAGSR
jgi:ABC-type branched-subunit amino acid transport system ATPase component